MTRQPALDLLLRTLPWSSPIRRMWAGTKLVGLGVIAVATVIAPGWGAAWAILALVALAGLTARVPRTVIPRPPLWALAIVVIGALTAFLGGGLDLYLQGTLIAAGLISLGLIVTWTTPSSDVAAAVGTLLAPLGRAGAPAGIWAATTALTVRSLSLIASDLRVILDVRRLRRPPTPPRRDVLGRVNAAGRDGIDVATAALSVAARRARDVGTAVAARGGPRPLLPARPRLALADLAAAAAVSTAVAIALTVP